MKNATAVVETMPAAVGEAQDQSGSSQRFTQRYSVKTHYQNGQAMKNKHTTAAAADTDEQKSKYKKMQN